MSFAVGWIKIAIEMIGEKNDRLTLSSTDPHILIFVATVWRFLAQLLPR